MADERPCGAPTPTGPCTNPVVLWGPTTRCAECRKKHRRAKQADYQWARRGYDRDKRIARKRAGGQPNYDEPPVPPRALTASWTQQGEEVRPGPDSLAEVAERLAVAEVALADARARLDTVMRRR